jgi:hypothetical protein
MHIILSRLFITIPWAAGVTKNTFGATNKILMMKNILLTALLSMSIAVSAFATGEKNLPAFHISTEAQNAKTGADKSSTTSENQLPVPARKALAMLLVGYQLKHATRNADGDLLYISAENEKEDIIVTIDNNLDVSIFKKVKSQTSTKSTNVPLRSF